MKTNIEAHGRIKCVTITTPLFTRSLNDYRRILGFVSIEDGILDADLAEAWAAPDSTGKNYALLQHKSGGGSFVRLIEATRVPDFVALRSFGWACLNLAVSNLASLCEDIDADGAFKILSAPDGGADYGHRSAATICGQADEILTLIDSNDAITNDLLAATLATPNSQSALDYYVSAFQFEAGSTQAKIQSATNAAFGLPDNATMPVSTAKANNQPVIEFEQYPSTADIRHMYESELPPGISIVTFAVRSLDDVEEDFLSEPCVRPGALYAGRRTATVMGPADELIELIEIG
jgi:catechol 2,3-dioxygenase-like lactoylglutathione lyase family enzyme